MIKEMLKQFRKAKGWTQNDLAERSGYSRSSIINWESGKRAPRSVDIEKLDEVLGVSPSDFLNCSKERAIVQDMPENEDEQQNNDSNFVYWSGVLNNVIELVESGDMKKIELVTPLFKSALSILLSVQKYEKKDFLFTDREATHVSMLTNNGDNNQNFIGIGNNKNATI